MLCLIFLIEKNIVLIIAGKTAQVITEDIPMGYSGRCKSTLQDDELSHRTSEKPVLLRSPRPPPWLTLVVLGNSLFAIAGKQYNI